VWGGGVPAFEHGLEIKGIIQVLHSIQRELTMQHKQGSDATIEGTLPLELGITEMAYPYSMLEKD